MYSLPTEYAVSENVIFKDNGINEYLGLLREGAKALENGGADFIVIPCNSVHIFIDEIRDCVNIPVLSIIEEVTNVLARDEIKKVAVLSSLTTTNNKLYENSLEKIDISCMPVDPDTQIQISELIYRGTHGIVEQTDKELLIEIIDRLTRLGADRVVLGCTDLHLFIDENTESQLILDTMQVLMDKTFKEMIGS